MKFKPAIAFASCSTLTVCPAIVKDPDQSLPWLLPTVKARFPLPIPEAVPNPNSGGCPSQNPSQPRRARMEDGPLPPTAGKAVPPALHAPPSANSCKELDENKAQNEPAT